MLYLPSCQMSRLTAAQDKRFFFCLQRLRPIAFLLRWCWTSALYLCSASLNPLLSCLVAGEVFLVCACVFCDVKKSQFARARGRWVRHPKCNDTRVVKLPPDPEMLCCLCFALLSYVFFLFVCLFMLLRWVLLLSPESELSHGRQIMWPPPWIHYSSASFSPSVFLWSIFIQSSSADERAADDSTLVCLLSWQLTGTQTHTQTQWFIPLRFKITLTERHNLNLMPFEHCHCG